MTQVEFDMLLSNRATAAARVARAEPQPRASACFLWESATLPVSANELVRPIVMGMRRNKKGKLVPQVRLAKSKVAREWLAVARVELEIAARRQSHRLYRGIPLRLELEVVVPSISSDATNRVKALEDACKGIVWSDDCQVVEALARKVLAADVGAARPVVRLIVEPCASGREMTKRMAKSKDANNAAPTEGS
jgi:Holliday junction resolvase RusA-like endonuclease